MTKEFPCIICENGDVYSNVLCDKCEDRQNDMKEAHDDIRRYISLFNGISGSMSLSLGNKLDEEAEKIFNVLYNIKINFKEVNGRLELLDGME